MSARIKRSVAYPDAEVRGQLRAWKRKLAERYAEFELACAGRVRAMAVDLVKRPAERQRTLEQIKRALGDGVTLESFHRGRRAHAIFSILKPREAVLMAKNGGPASGTLAQDCVSVNYIVIGYMPGPPEHVSVADGLWTLEVPDHALGRAVERSRALHPGVIIRQAHLNLLALPQSVAASMSRKDDAGVLIKAGAGAFVAELRLAPDVSTHNAVQCHVRVKTWLADDMLGADQNPLCEPGEPGDRLGDAWLRPAPFRRIVRAGDHEAQALSWRGE
jgi:hypothetical protein